MYDIKIALFLYDYKYKYDLTVQLQDDVGNDHSCSQYIPRKHTQHSELDLPGVSFGEL